MLLSRIKFSTFPTFEAQGLSWVFNVFHPLSFIWWLYKQTVDLSMPKGHWSIKEIGVVWERFLGYPILYCSCTLCNVPANRTCLVMRPKRITASDLLTTQLEHEQLIHIRYLWSKVFENSSKMLFIPGILCCHFAS